MNIGKEIALEAKKFGLCAEWYRKMLSVTTYKQLAEMYFDGDDWSMEKDFPGIELLRKHSGALVQCAMMVDVNGSFLENFQRIAFFGDSKLEIRYDAYNVGNIIVRHQSKIKVVASGNSKVFINLLDAAEVEVIAKDEAEVIIYNYGQQTNYYNNGNVTVKRKSWER